MPDAVSSSALALLPLHGQLRERVRSQILDGTFAPHDQLPSESQLGVMFNVSRITVRQALSDLQHEGLIFRLPGKGAFVAKPKAFQQLSQLEGFATAMTRMGYEVRNRVLSHREVRASPRVAERLDVPVGRLVCQIKRVRSVNRAPVSYEITHVPVDIGERLQAADLEGRDIFDVLEKDFGIVLGHADLQVDAMLADAAMAKQLDTVEGAALLHIERQTYNAGGAPIDFEDLYFRGDAFQYRLRLDRLEASRHG